MRILQRLPYAVGYTGLISLIIGVLNVKDSPLFMAFLVVLFGATLFERAPASKALKSALGGNDASPITTWVIGATFLTNVVLPILDYRYSTPLAPTGWLNWLGLTIFALGSALRAWAVAAAGEAFQTHIVVSPKQRLVTTGPYAWLRHPAYLATILSYAGIAMIFHSALGAGVLLVLVIPTLIVRVFKEEQVLAAHFGEGWQQYTGKTTSMLMPGL